MTYEFEYLMQLMGAAATGKTAPPPAQKADLEKVLALADQQQILPLISHALKKDLSKDCPDVLNTVLTGYAQRSAVISLLGEMERAGIQSYVIKGFAAGVNYAAPEYRISSDADIVIDPADEDRACEFLKHRGFSVKPRWEKGHHAVATHPAAGTIEVHVRLYDDLVEEVWFSHIDTATLLQEPRQQIVTPDGAYWTLGYTDHLIFMALHMVKHFILCGMSLRMMMDVALAIAKHREQVDMERFWSTLRSVQYDKLMNAILWAMVRYCGFAAEDFSGLGQRDDGQIALILDDLEKGGWLGKNAMAARKAGWHEYNRRILMKNKSKMQYRFYMLNWKHSFKLSTVFPGRKRLSYHYPCVIKYPFLIPFVWIHRIVFRGFALLHGKTWTESIVHDENEISSESKARVAMFQALDML